MGTKKARKLSSVYAYGIFVLVVIVVISGVIFTKSDDVEFPIIVETTHEDIVPVSASTTVLLLPRKVHTDFTSLLSTLSGEDSFESAMVRDEDGIISSIPEITEDSVAKIESTIDTLPADDSKGFCSKLPAYSDTLIEKITETKKKIDNTFEKRLSALDAEKILMENKKARNRNLRDEQLATYFARIENVLATSTSFTTLSTEITNTLREVRRENDEAVNIMHDNTIDKIAVYQKSVDLTFSNFYSAIFDKIVSAKNDCSKGVSSKVVRLSMHASLLVLQKNLLNSIQSLHYPQDELSTLVQAKNDKVQVYEKNRQTLHRKLEKILETIPKK
ncbi:hypothetical protein EPO17_00295 [Patescibacteria group bacterium]|nr:MAG: hypothetical protein EPO17_00295 [Patescibacteria group bacterium]